MTKPGSKPPKRLAREEKTIATMIGMYCRDKHGGGTKAEAVLQPGEAQPESESPGAGDLCEECSAVLAYARRRLEHCPYGVDKPTCANCTTHCYKPAMREQVREIMRYAGPRMAKEHPLLAAAHLVDGHRQPKS